MKKPLIKDMVDYFYDDDNWKEIWISIGEANLRIDVLKHTSITRLVHINVKDYYIGCHDMVIVYSLEVKNLLKASLGNKGTFLGRYLRSTPNFEEIRTAIKTQWEENE